jgi:hypothetical protein
MLSAVAAEATKQERSVPWLLISAMSASAVALVLVGITGAEIFAGKPYSAIVRNAPGHGHSVGGGSVSTPDPAPSSYAPSRRPVRPSPSATLSTLPAVPAPSPSARSPGRTPTVVPSPGPATPMPTFTPSAFPTDPGTASYPDPHSASQTPQVTPSLQAQLTAARHRGHQR